LKEAFLLGQYPPRNRSARPLVNMFFIPCGNITFSTILQSTPKSLDWLFPSYILYKFLYDLAPLLYCVFPLRYILFNHPSTLTYKYHVLLTLPWYILYLLSDLSPLHFVHHTLTFFTM
jgi:hypothetical protein